MFFKSKEAADGASVASGSSGPTADAAEHQPANSAHLGIEARQKAQALSKLISASIGEIAVVLSRSPAYKHCTHPAKAALRDL